MPSTEEWKSRHKQLRVWVTVAEHDAIVAEARLRNTTVSQLMRPAITRLSKGQKA